MTLAEWNAALALEPPSSPLHGARFVVCANSIPAEEHTHDLGTWELSVPGRTRRDLEAMQDRLYAIAWEHTVKHTVINGTITI